MLTVIGCFITENDPWLVALATIICTLAASATHCTSETRTANRRWLAWRLGRSSRRSPAGRASGPRISSPCWPSSRGCRAGTTVGPTLLSLGVRVSQRARPRDRAISGRAGVRSLARRRDPGRRHRGHALHRHGGLRGRRATWSGMPASSSLSLVLGAVFGRAAATGRPDRRQARADRILGAGAAAARDLQPSLHRHGRRHDRARSERRRLGQAPCRRAGSPSPSPSRAWPSCCSPAPPWPSTSATGSHVRQNGSACTASPTPPSKAWWSAGTTSSSAPTTASRALVGIGSVRPAGMALSRFLPDAATTPGPGRPRRTSRSKRTCAAADGAESRSN